MAFDYAQAQEDAADLIIEFGGFGAFVVAGNNSGGYDENGNVIAPSPDVTIVGTITPLLRFKQMEIDGEQIQASDGYVFFYSEIEPPIDSKVTLNGETYRAIKVWKLDSVGGVNVYRKIQLRL